MKKYELRTISGNRFVLLNNVDGTIYEASSFEGLIKKLEKAPEFSEQGLSVDQVKEIFSKIERQKHHIMHELKIFFVKTVVATAVSLLLILLALPNISATVAHSVKILAGSITVDDKYFDSRFWLIRLPEKMNEHFEQLSDDEKKRIAFEYGKLIENLKFPILGHEAE